MKSEAVSVASSDIQLSVAPNPVSSSVAQLSYTLSTAAKVKIVIYSITGQVVSTIEEAKEAGQNTTDLDVSKLSAGTYIVSLADGQSVTKVKLIVNK